MLFTLGVAYADIAPNPIFVNGVIPSESCKIQMVSETVNAWIYKDSSIVECVFLLKNHSKKTSLSIGFPIMSFYHWNPPENWKPEKENFKVSIDNIKVEQFDRFIPEYILHENDRMKYMDSLFSIYYRHTYDSLKAVYPICSRKDEKNFYQLFSKIFDKIPSEKERINLKRKLEYLIDYQKTPWYLWKMEFDSLETKTVKLRYSIPCGIGYWDRYRYFKYILSTGSGWYKDIEKAEVNVEVIDFKFSKIDSISPTNYILDKKHNTIRWDIKNIEPTIQDNVYVEYSFGSKKLRYWYQKKFKFFFYKYLTPRGWRNSSEERKRYKEKCKDKYACQHVVKPTGVDLQTRKFFVT